VKTAFTEIKNKVILFNKQLRCITIGWLMCSLIIGLISWLIIVAIHIVWLGHKQVTIKADVVIVLGASAYHNKPSPVFEQRIRHGLFLYKQGYAKKIIFTGGFGEKNNIRSAFAESEVARNFALKNGVDDQDILLEKISRNTLENLLQAQKIMQRYDLQTAIIVSDPLHIARALRVAKNIGIKAYGSGTSSTLFRFWQLSWWRFLLQEVYLFHRDLVML